MIPASLLAAHEASARYVEVDGLRTAVFEQGEGEAVLCLHGVPVSAWLDRRVLPALAARGLRGIAYDLPGLGLSGRPADGDYTWSGLGTHALRLVDALGLERVHLVVHDIGGPVGFELAHAIPDRVASLTVLNTLIRVAEFRKPWVMRPFEVPWLGELWLRGMIDPLFVQLMYRQGIARENPERVAVPPEELLVHLRLLRREDGGRAFLKMMRCFETTAQKQARYLAVFDHDRPVQVVWGARDPALPPEAMGAIARELVGEDRYVEVGGKHFLQETHAAEIAEHVQALVARAGRAAGA